MGPRLLAPMSMLRVGPDWDTLIVTGLFLPSFSLLNKLFGSVSFGYRGSPGPRGICIWQHGVDDIVVHNVDGSVMTNPRIKQPFSNNYTITIHFWYVSNSMLWVCSIKKQLYIRCRIFVKKVIILTHLISNTKKLFKELFSNNYTTIYIYRIPCCE
jgi:hypothetical protein